MKKRIRVLLVLCLLLGLLTPQTLAAQEPSVYVRKHVSILYDNSGSMKEHIKDEKNLKWCYASYAAQTFTGLLNDTDTLSITFMDGSPLSGLDLKGQRQKAVSSVLDRTSSAEADTPVSKISSALTVLKNEGLKGGLGANDPGEQFWLVLTTDGVFRENGANLSVERVVSELDSIMGKYPDLHMVYFGIGARNDSSPSKAVDFRSGSGVSAGLLSRLNAHPNFTAVYAEDQEQIVETMRALSNQISGRYSVSDEVKINGSEVQLYLSGEGSPIRNIALMAQETNAKLVSAEAGSGTKLTVEREAQIRFPNNSAYDNVPSGTLGGYVALITAPGGGKIPNGSITLRFSEPVNAQQLSLMYEPAVHIRLKVERSLGSGKWEELPDSAELLEGDSLRASYALCEDGSEKELDAEKLFGRTEAEILYNEKPVRAGESFEVSPGDSLLDVHVSMMDGGYQISTSRTIHTSDPGAGDFTVRSSGPLELRRSEAADNTEGAVELTVLLRGQAINASYASGMSIKVSGDSGELKGKTENPSVNVFRFTPQDKDCKSGTYKLSLMYEGAELASEEIRILPNETAFTAEAGPGISIMSNTVGSNTDAVSFTVTAHRDDGDAPITAAEAEGLSVRAEGGGTAVSGSVGWQEGGIVSFTLRDANAVPGDYTVSLMCGEETLAQTRISVIRYDATYTVETVVSDPDTVDRFHIRQNTSSVSFIIYEDGVPCSAAQLEAMQDRLLVSYDSFGRLETVNVSIGTADGRPALVCTPTVKPHCGLRLFFQKILMSFHLTELYKDGISIGITVNVPKGDTGEGTLRLVGYEAGYLIFAIVFLALLVLIGAYLFANFKAVRLKKGRVWSFTMSYERTDHGLRLKANSSGVNIRLGSGWKFMLIKPINEKKRINGIVFEAKPEQIVRRKRSKFEFHRVHPTVVVQDTPSELRSWYHSAVSELAAGLLDSIRSGRPVTLVDGERKISANEFFSWNDPFAESQTAPGTTSVSWRISDGKAMIYKVTGNADNPSYTVWVYEADPQRTDRRKAAPTAGKRRKKKSVRSRKKKSVRKRR